ncbi:MAG: efflux RND transporter periplasmic adaptor subunit, partial [bacterium]|nr:efflux RND transporter periplasmic adaptor subunit [bacterium]
EADVGQVKEGQRASFAVDAFPGRTFPATVTRVNVGSNSTTSSSSSTTTTSTTGTVVAYTAVLTVDNRDETLRPGMTATADIITQELHDVLLVPNAALRFKPAATASGGGITSVLPGPGRMRRGGAKRQVNFGTGSSQTLYVVGEDGNPKAVQVTIGASDGSRTAIIGGGLKQGMRVITGQLAAGAEQPADEAAQSPVASDKKAQSSNRATDGSPATVGKLGNSGDAAPQIAPVAPAPAPTTPRPESPSRGTGRQSGT